jgi:molecular chaperone IbpA
MNVHASLTSNHPFFSNFSNWAIGHDRLFREMLRVVDNAPYPNSVMSGYPPHNLIKDEVGKYRVELAVAGFNKEELVIKTEAGKLIISGKKKMQTDDEEKVVHKGIAHRSFEKVFHLADNVVVENVSLENGMLSVKLEQLIPEEKKPKFYNL